MKAIQKLISLITILAIAAALCACTKQNKPDVPEDTLPIAPIAVEAEPKIALEYFYTSHLSEDNYMTDEDKPPEEYLKESLLTNERYMCRYFVKLYETDYSEEELIENVYPGDWRTGIPPKNLPKPICTTTRCPDGESQQSLTNQTSCPKVPKFTFRIHMQAMGSRRRYMIPTTAKR